MTMLGIDVLIAVWVLIFIPMLLLPLIQGGDDRATVDERGLIGRPLPEPMDVREIAALVSDRNLSQAA